MADRYWVSPNTVVQFSVAAQETVPTNLFFKPDGLKMYIVGQSGLDINEYDLSSAWQVSTATYLQSFSVSAQDTSPYGLSFNPDGTKMYVIGYVNDRIYEYNLSTAWNISTASYLQNFSVNTQEGVPRSIFFKPDGLKMYIVGTSSDSVHEYNLSSAWNISTASYLQSFSVAAQSTFPVALFFKPDGTKMYVVDQSVDKVSEYNLSTAWNISTASYLQLFSVAAQETSPSGLFFNSDGTTMYIVGLLSISVLSYKLSTPWNISTVTIDTWDGTAGSKWALTSGGAGGQAVPTTADDVFFDANSAGIVTIASGNTGAKSINCTGFAGTITGTANITVAGSITFVAGMTWSHTGLVTVTGTGTIISAGKSFTGASGGLTINGSAITVTLGDALIVGGNTGLTVTLGTFNTAGFSVTTTGLVSSNSNVRSIILNNSTVTIGVPGSGPNFTTTTNLTFNAGTSQLNLTFNTGTFAGASLTYYNVSIAAGLSRRISGTNTFNNLTLTGIGTGLNSLSFDNNQTVNGTLTCAGTSAINRAFIRSNIVGTTRTITAAAVSAADCDFRDITIAGVAAPISPTRGGDCGGNSGITFPAAKNSYRVGTNTTWAGSSSWALTSGAAGSDNNFPLAQDTAIIDNNTTLSGTLAVDAYNFGTVNASTRTTGITLNTGGTTAPGGAYGSFILGSGVTISGLVYPAFSGRGTQTFTSVGKPITFQIAVEKPSGAFELGDALTHTGSYPGILFTNGTFDAKNYNVTTNALSSNSTNVRTLNMGSGLWTLYGTGAVWDIGTTNLTLNKSTSNILLSDISTTSKIFNGGTGISYNKLTIGGATGTSTTQISQGIFTELASIKTVAHTVRFAFSGTVSIGTWSVTGTTGNLVTVESNATPTQRTFALTNSTFGLIDYLSVKDIGVTSPNLFFVGSNSINGGNNLNVYFTGTVVPATGSMFAFFIP